MNGAPASQYKFKPAAASISYTIEYEGEAARIYAGISLQEWAEMPGTRQWIANVGGRCKSDIIMIFRMANFIPSAANDAQAREMERKSKLPKRGR